MSIETPLAFVYLSPLSDETAFKIGKAKSPSARLLNLSEFHGLHATHTWLMGCPNEHSAFVAESFLHRVFHKYSIERVNDGGTEFFKMSCFIECRRIAAAYAAAHGHIFSQYLSPKPERGEPAISNSIVEISEKIRTRRLACNLKQEELAERAGISRLTYLRFENGENGHIGLSSFLRILKELGLSNVIDSMPKDETFRQRAKKG